MIRGDLNYDSMWKWLRLFEDDLIKMIQQEQPCKAHEDACRFMIAIVQGKLREYEERRDNNINENEKEDYCRPAISI
jgi:hypothetical protein